MGTAFGDNCGNDFREAIMTTLITGAGLVGTSFAQSAVRRGEDVVFFDPQPREDFVRAKLGNADFKIIDDDVRNLPGLVAAMGESKPDTVVHTASLIGGRVGNPMHNGYAVNVGGALNVAEAVQLTGVRRLVHLSTFGVYDWRRITEGPVAEDAPRGQGTPYSNSKVAQELIMEAYAIKYGFELIMLRPANVFGVGHFWSGSGGGQKVQDLVTAGITGRALDLATTVDLPDKTVFNIGYDTVTTFDELVAVVRKVLPALEVEITPGTPPLSRTIALDVSAARDHLGWEPEYAMEEAFADYAADLRAEIG